MHERDVIIYEEQHNNEEGKNIIQKYQNSINLIVFHELMQRPPDGCNSIIVDDGECGENENPFDKATTEHDISKSY